MRRYSTPSAGFSDLVSPLRISVPSFTSTLMSSLFIPGSSARIRYESLLSSTSTAGCHFDTLGRPKLSSNRSLNTERRLPKPVNGSHLTNSIVITSCVEKLKHGTAGSQIHLTNLHFVLNARQRSNSVTKKEFELIPRIEEMTMAKTGDKFYEWDRQPRMPVPPPPAGSCDCQFH